MAAGAKERGAHSDRRLRSVRHRPSHPQGPLAQAVAVAVHPRQRAGRRHRRSGPRIQRRLHGQAASRRLEGDDPAADAVRALLLLRALSAAGQQMPDPGLLRALSRLRQAAAFVGRLRGIRLCRSRHAAGHEGLQASRRHAAEPGGTVRAAGIEILRDGGTYVELGPFTAAGSIATSWHRICAKALNVLGSWAFTANDLPLGVDMLDRARDRYPWLDMQTLYPFDEDGVSRAVK